MGKVGGFVNLQICCSALIDQIGHEVGTPTDKTNPLTDKVGELTD